MDTLSRPKHPRHRQNEADKELLIALHRKITALVGELPQGRLVVQKIKVFLLPAIYLFLYGTALVLSHHFWQFCLLYSLMGIMLVVIFSNLIHELCHGNIFKSARTNAMAYHIFDLLGANSFIWKQRHLLLHHRYPNVNGWDADVEQKGPIAVFPNEPVSDIHRNQHWYVFMLYPLFLLNWLLVRDFRDYFFSKNRTIMKAISIPMREYIKLFFFKAFFLGMTIVLPSLYTEFNVLQVILAFLIFIIIASLTAMLILLTPHINSGNEFPTINDRGEIPISWLRHQLITTNDITTSNWFTRNVLGNFNFHVAHHIFPRISSVYAPEVTAAVEAFLLEHDLPYRSYPLGKSFRMHYKLIKANALRSKTQISKRQ